MATGLPGAAGTGDVLGAYTQDTGIDNTIQQNLDPPADKKPADGTSDCGKQTQKKAKRLQQTATTVQAMSGQGAQFVYTAATIANILCDNLSATQINLLANFLSVVTTCVYAILTVENPTDVLET